MCHFYSNSASNFPRMKASGEANFLLVKINSCKHQIVAIYSALKVKKNNNRCYLAYLNGL